MIKQMHDTIDDYSREVKNAKIQKVFFKVDTAQQPIQTPYNKTLPDGTTAREVADGLRLQSTILITAVTPQDITEKTTQIERETILAGNLTVYIYQAVLVTKDCFREEDFKSFEEELANAKETALGDVQKVANVMLYPGTIGV